MFCGVVVSFHIPKGFDSVCPIIKDIACLRLVVYGKNWASPEVTTNRSF